MNTREFDNAYREYTMNYDVNRIFGERDPMSMLIFQTGNNWISITTDTQCTKIRSDGSVEQRISGYKKIVRIPKADKLVFAATGLADFKNDYDDPNEIPKTLYDVVSGCFASSFDDVKSELHKMFEPYLYRTHADTFVEGYLAGYENGQFRHERLLFKAEPLPYSIKTEPSYYDVIGPLWASCLRNATLCSQAETISDAIQKATDIINAAVILDKYGADCQTIGINKDICTITPDSLDIKYDV